MKKGLYENMNCEFDNKITYTDYRNLRAAVGWRAVSERQFEAGLKNTHYILVIKVDNKAVGLIKALGDMGYYWLMVDVIVHPDYQGQGLGRELVGKFLQFVDYSTMSGENIHIALLSAKGKESFYEKFGFKTRPYGDDLIGAGMSLFYTKE
ncbi:MAG: GNAT family N-acetyltransferase [Oscillospiraceae bacterium]|nr:GNAT family N-acetyltransferase [Oscillospiraceae bacterium]